MSQTRTKPPMQRRIRNLTGLYFRDGGWIAYANEATVFSTVSEALRARRTFGLEQVQLAGPFEPSDMPPHYN